VRLHLPRPITSPLEKAPVVSAHRPSPKGRLMSRLTGNTLDAVAMRQIRSRAGAVIDPVARDEHVMVSRDGAGCRAAQPPLSVHQACSMPRP